MFLPSGHRQLCGLSVLLCSLLCIVQVGNSLDISTYSKVAKSSSVVQRKSDDAADATTTNSVQKTRNDENSWLPQLYVFSSVVVAVKILLLDSKGYKKDIKIIIS